MTTFTEFLFKEYLMSNKEYLMSNAVSNEKSLNISMFDILKNDKVIATLDAISEESFTNGDIKIKILFNNDYYYFLNGVCIDGKDMSLRIEPNTPKEYPISSLPFDINKAKNNEIIIQRIDDNAGNIRWFPCRLQKNHQ